MIEVADVFRRFADEYLSAHSASMPPSHLRAIADIQACRTEALGGHLWRCDQCAAEVFAWHSCKNRSCPKCHTDQIERWLEARRADMLPVPYFHVVVTVPKELRAVLRANQRDGYTMLMKAAAEDRRTRARPMSCRRHRRHPRRSAHLDPAASLPSARALPGHPVAASPMTASTGVLRGSRSWSR